MYPKGLKFAAPQLRRIVSNVEVERKFNPGPKFASLFLNNNPAKPQTQSREAYGKLEAWPFTVLRLPGQLIRDIYYDTHDDELCRLRGLWVRQRQVSVLPHSPFQLENYPSGGVSGDCAKLPAMDHSDKAQWNAKLRVGGHFNNSQFVEFDGKENVSAEILRASEMKTKLEDLQVTVDLQTRRQSWEVTQLANGATPSAKMTVVMDEVTEADASAAGPEESTFLHTIGEVELFQQLVTEDKEDAEHELYRKEVAAQRMAELKEFVLENPDLFSTTPKPIGKLSAYEAWKASRR
ncbi:hypothetical protein O1611_g449 [Lasiodiplodia mahajangana]|uniref:Uncharacterized protein n=1 Tax=Lasiodiplodia mahajangana TaxID=1108764 RepID=A0ACC2K0C1_9PEZI|nr:hypothetical protein O1611_g449 [Lasiodiplodia mahajangana]